MARKFLTSFFLLTSGLSIYAAPEPPSMLQSTLPSTIIIHNRLLAKVNGKHISVVDLMKKMDMIFYQEYPHLTSSVQARYQFYMSNWRAILDDMIDSELIMADAQEKKLSVSDGDVREELEELFGPNVVLTIDNFGMTFDEVWHIVLTDITVRRMTYAMVNSKAMHKINPRDIRQAYEEYALKNPKDGLWKYQVVSIQSETPERGQELVHVAYDLLLNKNADFQNLRSVIGQKYPLNESDQINISEPYERTDKSLSQAHKEILATLPDMSYSAPVSQQNRVNQQTVYRIFLLKEHVKGGIVPLREVEEEIKNRLIQKAVEAEALLYRKQLRQRFRIDDAYLREMIPDGFQPFSVT